MRISRKTSRAALAACALTVATLVAPMTPASADPGDTLNGGCGFSAFDIVGGQYQGVLFATALSQERTGLPSSAIVSCWIQVNGVEQPGTRFTVAGNGVIADGQPVSFPTTPGDLINDCQQVTFVDGSTWTAPNGDVGTFCSAPFAAAAAFSELPCPTLVKLAQLSGGAVFGVLRFGSDGDLYVAQPVGIGYTKIWDCAPYGN